MGDLIPDSPSLALPLPLPLPPGFRFLPSQADIFSYYLKNKQDPSASDIFQEIDVYGYDPRDLPETAWFVSKANPLKKRWYCFMQRNRDMRLKRKARGGYWKCKRRDHGRVVRGKEGEVLGTKKTFWFYRGRFARKTDWVMKEYDLVAGDADADSTKDGFVLCCVFLKSRAGDKTLKHNPSSYDEDNLAAAFNHDIGSPYELHGGALTSGNGKVLAEGSTVVGKRDKLHKGLMKLSDEPDNVVAPQPVYKALFPVVQLPNGIVSDVTDDAMGELIDSVILEGDFIELNDLLSPLPGVNSL